MTDSWSWSTVSLYYVGLVKTSNVGCPTLLQVNSRPPGVQQQGLSGRPSRGCPPQPAPWWDCMGNPSRDAVRSPALKLRPAILASNPSIASPGGKCSPYCLVQDFYPFKRQRTENCLNHKYKHLGSFYILSLLCCAHSCWNCRIWVHIPSWK